MEEQKKPNSSSYTFKFSWRRFLLHSMIIGAGLFFGLLSWLISHPHTTRLYETNAEQHQHIKIAPRIEIFLDTNSAVAITDTNPMQIELFKGNVYFDAIRLASNEIKIKVGKAFLKDVVGRFKVSVLEDGGCNVAVVEGKTEIQAASGTFLVNAGEQASFDGFNVSEHKLITESNIAPWRNE